MNGGAGVGIGGEAGGGVPCDTNKNPITEECLVADDYSVFVAPSGKDDAAGTKDAPVATLSKAIEIAGGKFVVVCDATYDEHVTITSGAQIYGGFDCADWSAETGAPLFKPTSAGPALKIDSVTAPVAISGLSFEVSDATGNGETALTALVNASSSVTFEGVSLKAGKGKAGAAGTLTAFPYPEASALNGNGETAAGNGGASKTCSCQPSFSSSGGLGGAPVASGQNGSKGLPDLGGGLGGDPAVGDCGAGSSGKKGASAMAASASAGATTVGSTTEHGWVPSGGVDGATGSPGQGGGGGASLNDLGHGGGGGCGGCGGNGATGGRGGGGSIALLLISSPVVISNSTLTTADGGDGGAGAAGQLGQQAVGSGGNSIASANSCGGGTGGKGGDGGSSGGGAGGISVGIVWKGVAAPTATGVTTTTGKAGAKGVGGVPGVNDGIAGVKQDVLQMP